MKWYEDYNTFFEAFVKYGTQADETHFLFNDESSDKGHFIGYIPNTDKPYWAGYCDIEEGKEYKTAEELFSAKIFNGKSIKDAWDSIIICEFGAVPVEDFPYKL